MRPGPHARRARRFRARRFRAAVDFTASPVRAVARPADQGTAARRIPTDSGNGHRSRFGAVTRLELGPDLPADPDPAADGDPDLTHARPSTSCGFRGGRPASHP